jgi:hypothetical protein
MGLTQDSLCVGAGRREPEHQKQHTQSLETSHSATPHRWDLGMLAPVVFAPLRSCPEKIQEKTGGASHFP